MSYSIENDKERTIYCGNLPDTITEEILYELFVQAGPLEKVHIPRKDGRPSSFAFVTFKHTVSVPYTLQLLSGIRLYGRQLRLQARSGVPANGVVGGGAGSRQNTPNHSPVHPGFASEMDTARLMPPPAKIMPFGVPPFNSTIRPPPTPHLQRSQSYSEFGRPDSSNRYRDGTDDVGQRNIIGVKQADWSHSSEDRMHQNQRSEFRRSESSDRRAHPYGRPHDGRPQDGDRTWHQDSRNRERSHTGGSSESMARQAQMIAEQISAIRRQSSIHEPPPQHYQQHGYRRR